MLARWDSLLREASSVLDLQLPQTQQSYIQCLLRFSDCFGSGRVVLIYGLG